MQNLANTLTIPIIINIIVKSLLAVLYILYKKMNWNNNNCSWNYTVIYLYSYTCYEETWKNSKVDAQDISFLVFFTHLIYEFS